MNNVDTRLSDDALTAQVTRPISGAGNVRFDTADNRLLIQLDGLTIGVRGSAKQMRQTITQLRDGLTQAIGG